jgi:outer membrane protein insertion porin family
MFWVFALYFLISWAWSHAFYCMAADENFQESVLSELKERRIKQVKVTCVDDLVKERVLSRLTLEPGEMFSSEKIQQNLGELYKSGEFSQIYVRADEQQDGLDLVFCPVLRLNIPDVTISGEKAPFATRALERRVLSIVSNVKIFGNILVPLQNIAPEQILKPGDSFTSKKLQDLKDHIEALYQERGFYNVQIIPHIETGEHGRLVDVKLEIIEGSQSQLGQIIFVGSSVFKDSRLLDILGIKTDKLYDKSELEQGFRRIRGLYFEEGFFTTEINELERKFDPVSQKIDLTLEVVEGYKVRFMEGNKTIKPGKILKKEIIDTIQSSELTELRIIASEVQNHYKKRGYYLAEVRFEEVEAEAPDVKNGRKTVVFTIDKKHKVTIKEISIQGNQAFSDKVLKSLMETKATSFFSRGSYDKGRVRDDMTAIKNYYFRHGYLSADVKLEPLQFSEDQKTMTITLSLSEGVQSVIKDIVLKGRTRFSSEELLRKIPLKPGNPLNPVQVRDSASILQSLYASHGYIKARVEPDIEWNSDKREAIVKFTIAEGDIYYIGAIAIKDTNSKRKRVVRREILVHQGDLYDPEKIRKTVRNILKLGIYNRVQFEPEGPPSEDHIQNMLLSLSEAKTRSIEFGLGYSTETQFNGSVELSDKTIFDYGGRGNLKVTAGFETFKVLVDYLQPRFFDRHLNLIANIFDDLDETKTSFDIRRRGAGIALEYVFSDFTKASLGYNFAQSDLFSVSKDAILDPALDTDLVDVGRLIFKVSRDNRDNLINPVRGSFHILQTDVALDALNAHHSFIKVTGQTSWYFPFLKRNVLAFSLKGGVAEPLEDSPGIPIFERFFAGGDNSIRGFEPETVGPLGTSGNPIGGDASLIFNGELRIPLYKFIQGVLFFDAGNVWLKDRDFDLPDLRYTGGSGLRLNTPVGLLRVEYGFKLNRLSDERPGAWHITIGAPF